jgi:hypothetical protein
VAANGLVVQGVLYIAATRGAGRDEGRPGCGCARGQGEQHNGWLVSGKCVDDSENSPHHHREASCKPPSPAMKPCSCPSRFLKQFSAALARSIRALLFLERECTCSRMPGPLSRAGGIANPVNITGLCD